VGYRIAGIDVHKKMLAVVVADIAIEGGYDFDRRQFGASPDELRRLADWLIEQKIQEVVMESTAQYWRPVWQTLERYWKAACRGWEGAGPMSGSLLLAQAQSNRGPRGRKKDFVDAERLVKRLVAQELILSFVPDSEQRLWRTVMRRKYQLTCDRVRLRIPTKVNGVSEGSRTAFRAQGERDRRHLSFEVNRKRQLVSRSRRHFSTLFAHRYSAWRIDVQDSSCTDSHRRESGLSSTGRERVST